MDHSTRPLLHNLTKHHLPHSLPLKKQPSQQDSQNSNSNNQFFSQNSVPQKPPLSMMQVQSDSDDTLVVLEDRHHYIMPTYAARMSAAKRKVVVEWMLATARTLHVCDRTVYLAIDLFDRTIPLLTCLPSEGRVGVIAVTCLHIASKFEEIYPRGLNDLLGQASFQALESIIIKTEAEILELLQYRIEPSPWQSFLHLLAPALTPQEVSKAKCAVEVGLLHFLTARYQKGIIARAGMLLAKGIEGAQLKKVSRCVKEIFLRGLECKQSSVITLRQEPFC